jgi:hypothetical protein
MFQHKGNEAQSCFQARQKLKGPVYTKLKVVGRLDAREMKKASSYSL